MEFLLDILPAALTAILALAGSYYGASRAADAQMKTAALQIFLAARLDAYKNFLAALETWSNERATPQSFAGLYRASSGVALVASKKTNVYLKGFQNIIRNWEMHGPPTEFADFDAAKARLLESMHDDLLKYPVIKPEPKPTKDALW